MASCGYTAQCFETMVKDSRILFRSGVSDLLRYSQAKSIPLFVLSAGIKEVIDASFRMIDDEVDSHEHLRVISNEFEYHEGKTVARPLNLIHPYAKRE